MSYNKNINKVSNNTDTHSLSYVKIPKELWADYVTYQYYRFKKQQTAVVTVVMFFFLAFNLAVKYSFPELFLNDLISRVLFVIGFVFFYFLFFLKKKDSELNDILISVFCLVESAHWLFLTHNHLNHPDIYHLTLTGASFFLFTAFIKSRFRYAVITVLFIAINVLYVMFSKLAEQPEEVIVDFLFILLPMVIASLFICWDNIQRSRSHFLKQHRFATEKDSLAEYNQDLLEQVYTDGLTQIGNKRLFETESNSTITEAKELKIFNVAILIVDIDFFKNYNDNYGHLEGDKCLYAISQALKNISNAHNANIYRFGGEEFVLSQKYNSKYEVISLARALISGVSELHIPHDYRGDSKNYLTISIGGCLLHEGDFNNLHEMLDIADQKLYQAKSEGKETFVL